MELAGERRKRYGLTTGACDRAGREDETMVPTMMSRRMMAGIGLAPAPTLALALALTLALTLAPALNPAGTALAHSRSEATVPADGATVASVKTIEMRFDAPMRVTAIKLLSGGGEVAIERETGMEPVTEFRAAPAAALAPGAYSVEWRGLSDDGHPMQGSFGFTVGE